MSNSNDSSKKPMKNAEAIIERFGGIRPMAKKIDVAVTTIQGWKKRNTIPANRRGAIMNAAMDYNIDLSGVADMSAPPVTLSADADHTVSASSSSVNKNDDGAGAKKKAPTPSAVRPSAPTPSPAPSPVAPAAKPVRADKEEVRQAAANVISDLEAQLATMEKRMMTKNMIFTTALTLLVVGAGAFLLWPKSDNNAAQIEAMKQEMAAMEAEAQANASKGGFGNLIPQNLKNQIEGQINDLKSQAAQVQSQVSNVQQQVTDTMSRVEGISTDVLGDQAGDLGQRLSKLEEHMGDLIGSPSLSALLSKFQVMQGDGGSGQLSQAVKELNTLFATQQDSTVDPSDPDAAASPAAPMGVDALLNKARAQSSAIGQTFDGVPKNELKAAGMLLGFTQIRGALNRDGQPFADDLVLLQNLVGDNPELQAQIEKLAPHAESGVLTPSGLSGEFRTLAGDMVVSSLKGEDVSVKDRASAKLNQLLQIEKDGELVTGTPVQATINRTEGLLEQGDLAGAISAAKSLNGPEAQLIAPWIAKAEATLAGKNLESMVGGLLSGKGIEGLSNLMPKKLIMNEATGINILAPAGLSTDIGQ